MTLNLSDSELKAIVKSHINNLIGVDTSRLKVTFTRRSTQTDTSIEIFNVGESRSILDPDQEIDNNTEEESAHVEPTQEVHNNVEKSTMSTVLK